MSKIVNGFTRNRGIIFVMSPKEVIGGFHPPIAAYGCHWIPLVSIWLVGWFNTRQGYEVTPLYLVTGRLCLPVR